ncbi:hypothetical protein N7492_009541 [Penicillium capsulatum]|uniref:Sulfatase N-terminal domain-containing protein n=1 Tax=Penicillium capsulatum TaxID=69766 RepID=A0A9W9HU65_9EURO|nr:hypothetical protein N7492_009541 [Penicillium capsulatum]
MIIIRSSLLRPFLLSLLLVSALSSKLLHLSQHASSLPAAQFILFLPTFFLQEALLCGAAWFLLTRSTGWKAIAGTAVTAFVAVLTFVLASSQFGFYLVTSNEIRWDAATSVGNDPEGRKLMMSGIKSFLLAATVLLIPSWLGAPAVWSVINGWLITVFSAFSTDKLDEALPLANLQHVLRKERGARFWTIFAAVAVAALHLFRPGIPYNHMSGALPFTFFNALRSKNTPPSPIVETSFPLPELLRQEFWEPPRNHFKGWAPGRAPEDESASVRPPWASGSLPDGFQRWQQTEPDTDDTEEEEEEESPKNYYDPVNDPLRITNLDHDMINPLKEAFKSHDVPINHVVLVMMESARKDVFPLKSDSHLYEEIISSYDTSKTNAIKDLNSKLAYLTPIAEMLTGEKGGFPDRNTSDSELWQDTAEAGMGGINVHGMLTGSSLSFKSAAMNHCGVGPLPVNFMGEVHADIYQPCIMHIFDLFNQMKENLTTLHKPDSKTQLAPHVLDRNWTSVFLQSITGDFDEQTHLNDKMGFKKTIYREDISRSRAKHYHSDMEEINYFGYSEREIYPYLKDVINETLANNERLFLSHFTSTTHHPWGTPSDFDEEQYFAPGRLTGKHKDLNSYLNSVRYVDAWLGDLMKVLDDTGIANETLVVFIADHGQAFQEDSGVQGTYENPHISNFRIPLVFRHPLLPKIQITANATSMSVLPTILDLLVQTKSLDQTDSAAALDLMNEYEGQSLIRPYQASHNGRQAWNFGIINAGGTMLSVGSAAVPYRLILPLTEDFEYVFSNLDKDPNELNTLREWSMEDLVSEVTLEHGADAGEWMTEAAQVGHWWVKERKRLWNAE